jgi:hypothetical protein
VQLKPYGSRFLNIEVYEPGVSEGKEDCWWSCALQTGDMMRMLKDYATRGWPTSLNSKKVSHPPHHVV